MNKAQLISLELIVAMSLLAGCVKNELPNPASKYCIEQGGTLDIITAEDGSQSGACTLPGGTVCDEWAYYRHECPDCSGGCPMYSPPALGWCEYGTIVPGGKNDCGCQLPPECVYTACTEEAKLCSDGITSVVRVGPNCEFAPCPDELEKNYCTPESRQAEVCTLDYTPVCGWFNQDIKCIKYPCAINAGNACQACQNENVEFWTEGVCPNTPPQ
jgi:putative hemolysin